MIDIVAASAGATAIAASCRWNWWRPRIYGGIPALLYHNIGDAPDDPRLNKNLWVTKPNFQAQMEYVKRHGYTTISLREMRDIECGKMPAPAKPILVTFDDGYANNFENAYPVLKELGLKGCIFIVYEAVGGRKLWDASEAEPPIMNWAQIREMQDSGVIEFASHTMRHRDLSSLSRDEARWEICESKKRFEERLGGEMVGFAYPYGAGAFAPALRELAREAGYCYDFSAEQGISPFPRGEDRGSLKRLFIGGGDSLWDLHLQITRGRARFPIRSTFMRLLGRP